MKIAGILLFAASAAFGQNSPDNVASDSFQKRLQSMNLLSAPGPRILRRVAPAGALKPGVCAIPLLSVTPSPALDTNMVVTPRATATPGDELVNVPAPACEK